jgi:perosamine synthetase
VRRRLALLGGTSTAGDALTAAAFILLGAPVDGPALAAYEGAFAAVAGTRFATSLATARVGLFAVLRGLHVGRGDEVLLQAPTHVVVANAIRYTGARPVYVDCLRSNWNIDLADAERKVTPRSRVLVLQHSFGIPADLDAACDFAERHGLVLVEDCVHALGARWRGRPVGSFGRAAIFSTEETKIISTTMGGMVVTDDPAMGAHCKAFQEACTPPPQRLVARYLLKFVAYHVLTQPTVHALTRTLYELAGRRQPLPTPTTQSELAGGPRPDYEQSLSAAQAALGLRQLHRLEANLRHRRRIAGIYDERLRARGWDVPAVPHPAQPSWVRFPVAVPDREEALAALAPHTVVGRWFSSVLEEATSRGTHDYERGSCPVAEWAAAHLVNLPTHERVGPADAERIVAALSARSPS